MNDRERAVNPLFSIITVTYNAEKELPVTLASVDAQSFGIYEHLIIDGASHDHTMEIARNHANCRRKVFSSPDKGLYDAMNKGLARATGEYVVFLNAGDAFHAPETLKQIAETITTNHYPDIVYGQTQLVDAERQFVGMRHLTAPKHLTFDSFKHGMLVCHQAFIAKRELAEMYDLKYRFSADYEWCLRCLKKMKTSAYTGTTIIDYLIAGITDKNHKASLKERYHIMCDYYGTLPTIVRHIGFFVRNLKRKFN